MTKLIPVQRADRNGKIVTRHVKEDAGAPGAKSVPPPSILSASTPQVTFRGPINPSQSKPKQRDAAGGQARYTQKPVAFTASDVEVYGVLSVAQPATALRLLAQGVSTADTARAALMKEGREHELVDNAWMSNQMLQRRVNSEFYLMAVERLTDEQMASASPEFMADYIEFFGIRSIMRKDSPKIADEVLAGAIRLADVREVGIDSLKTGNRLEIVSTAFRVLASGDAKFTTQELGSLLRKSLYGRELEYAVDYMVQRGGDASRRLKLLNIGGFGGLSLNEMEAHLYPDEDDAQAKAFPVIDYASRMVEAENGLTVERYEKSSVTAVLSISKMLHDAGVDVEYAVARIHDQEPREIAASYEGLHNAVGGGWL